MKPIIYTTKNYLEIKIGKFFVQIGKVVKEYETIDELFDDLKPKK